MGVLVCVSRRPETNSKLRAVIQNAKSANMPKDNIQRAIKNASEKNSENYKEYVAKVSEVVKKRFLFKLDGDT